MRVISIAAKDVYVTIEHSMEEINNLILYLENCNVKAEGDDAQKIVVAGRFAKEHYDELVAIKKNVEGEQ